MNPLYLFFSLGGVAMVAALCAMLFGLQGLQIATEQTVEAYLTQILPAFRARSIVLGAGRKTALVENDVDGSILLVVAHGDAFVTRRLSKTLLRAIVRNGADLFLRLTDFTLPRAKLTLGDPAIATLWEAKLAGVTP